MPLFTQPFPVLIICTCFITYPDLYQRKAFYDQFVLPPDSLALPVNLLPKHAPWQKLHGIISIWIILEDLDHGALQEAHPSIIRPIFLLTLHHLLVLPHPPKTYLSSTGQLPLNPSPAYRKPSSTTFLHIISNTIGHLLYSTINWFIPKV